MSSLSEALTPFLGGVAVGAGLAIVFASASGTAAAEPTASVPKAACSAASDVLALQKAQLTAEWEATKSPVSSRVDRQAFVAAMLAKHKDKLSDKSAQTYEAFLNTCFDAGLGLMLYDPSKTDLGRHCFSYANILAGEFYFAAAKDAADGCGCSSPVSDVLTLTDGNVCSVKK